jgi:predicted RNA polymerase sigma factor
VDDVAALDADARTAVEDAARRSYGKLVAFLAARTRDVAAAEDALSEAFAAALADWPASGCPRNPEAWLLTAARRKQIDAARKRKSGETAAAELAILADEIDMAEHGAIPDRRLALMFACAHPALDPGIRSPLMLQTVLGLPAARIASAFLVSPEAMGKRLGRAKEKIRDAGIRLEVPARDDLAGRLDAVLEAVYAAYAEGWSDPGGADAVRRDLTEEAVYLARLAAGLSPGEPEALGLLALMLYAHARRGARRDANGEYVPLAAQDPALWDARMIAEAETLLGRASAFKAIGRYQLEAAVQSAHVHRRRSGRANWKEVLGLYDALAALTDSPVVAVNRAVALAEARGADAALAALDAIADDTRLAEYQPYWAARAELLARSGARGKAERAYEIAIGLERDPAVRRFLERRRSQVSPRSGGSNKFV